MSDCTLPSAAERAAMIAGDCRVVLPRLPEGCAACAVYSPNYNLGASPSARKHPRARRGTGLDWRGYGADPDCLPEAEYQAEQLAILSALYRVIRPGGSVFYQHQDRCWAGQMISPLQWLYQSPFLVRQQLVWVEGQTQQWDGAYFPPVHQYVFWLTRGALAGRPAALGAVWTSVWTIKPTRHPDHPAPFPAEVARRCILTASEIGDLVLDPCAGMAQTGIAAVQLGRRFLGIERQPAFVSAARANLATELYGLAVVGDCL